MRTSSTGFFRERITLTFSTKLRHVSLPCFAKRGEVIGRVGDSLTYSSRRLLGPSILDFPGV
jgi:hypothetical protein